MARPMSAILGLCLCACDGFYVRLPRQFGALRVASPRMESQSWPPPLDAVHTFTLSMGGGKERVSLALSQVSNEKTSGEPGGLDHVTLNDGLSRFPCSSAAHQRVPIRQHHLQHCFHFGSSSMDKIARILSSKCWSMRARAASHQTLLVG